MQHVEVQKLIPAPVQTVWNRYTDHVSWTEWSGMGNCRLEREGVPAPNGVGCIRAFSRFGITAVYEQVLLFEIPQRMVYKIVKGGGPIGDHEGEVLFEPSDGGTLITWRCKFNSKVPGMGGAIRAMIKRMFNGALEGLAKDLSG